MRSDIIPKYFRLDTTSLIHLLFTKKQGNKSFYLTNGNLVKYQEKIWNFFFKTNLKCFHSDDNYKYKFHCMIETDGVGVSILLIRKDLEGKRATLKSPKVTLNSEKYINELTEDEYTHLQEKNVVAIDPNNLIKIEKLMRLISIFILHHNYRNGMGHNKRISKL